MNNRLLLPIFAVLFTAAVSFGLNAFASFTEPTVAPPGNNAPAPLETSNIANVKIGMLFLNTGGSQYGLIVTSGKVGIGTQNPTQPLEVAGIIKSSSGGIMFPDGSIQASAGVITDTTLTGKGTTANPLRVSSGGGTAQKACQCGVLHPTNGQWEVVVPGYSTWTAGTCSSICTQSRITSGGIWYAGMACISTTGYSAGNSTYEGIPTSVPSPNCGW